MIDAFSAVVKLSSSSLWLSLFSARMYVYDVLFFACKFMPLFFSFIFPREEMSHKKRRESTKIFFRRNHPKELRFFLIYIFLKKYAESMQKVCSAKALLCLTLSTYLVLQQLSYFKPNQNR